MGTLCWGCVGLPWDLCDLCWGSRNLAAHTSSPASTLSWLQSLHPLQPRPAWARTCSPAVTGLGCCHGPELVPSTGTSACGSLSLGSWRQCLSPDCPCGSQFSLGYSHVGLRGVRQGDAEVGDVLEDTKGRGGMWDAVVGVSWMLAASFWSFVPPTQHLLAGEGSGGEMKLEAGNCFPLAFKARLNHTRASFPCGLAAQLLWDH